MIQAAFHHRIRGRLAIFLEQMLFEAASINPNAHGTVVIPCGLDDLLNAGLRADIARVDPQTRCARLGCLNPPHVVEVDIRHDRNRHLGDNLLERRRTVFVRHGNPHDVCPGLGASVHLFDRASDIRRDGVRHGLHRNRRITAHGNGAYGDLATFPTIDIAPGANVIDRHA